jgi:ppGpp synthetase/RelA/SpoT-type nucleotidyltranferase
VSLTEAKEFISHFHSSLIEASSWKSKMTINGAIEYSTRLKDSASLFEKMRGRFWNRTLDSVGDVVGARAICKNISDQDRLVESIRRNFRILEHDNSVSGKIRSDGYRAHHFTIRSKDGRLIEL